MDIKLELDTSELKKAQEYLRDFPKKLERIQKRALRESGKVLYSAIVKQTSQVYNIQPSRVRSVTELKTSTDMLRVITRDSRHSIRYWHMKPKRAPRPRPKQAGYVTYEIRRGKRIKEPDLFILNNVANNPIGVYRTGKGRNDFKIRYGASIAQLVDNDSVTEDVKQKVQERYNQQVRYWTLREMGMTR